MKTFLSIFIGLVLLFTTAFSQDVKETESWYTYWGIGYAGTAFPSELQELVDSFTELDEEKTISLGLDLFGFYMHITPKTIGGFVVNTASKRVDVRGIELLKIRLYTYSASMFHYFGESFGNGPFMRADVGYTSHKVENKITESENKKDGWGVLAGGGWSFDFGGTRLLLNINYAVRGVEGDYFKTLGISAGGLF